MWTFQEMLKNFFTHKDFLPAAELLPGTLFTPLHMAFAVICAVVVALLSWYFSKKSEKTVKTAFAAIWAFVVVCEIIKIIWETCAGVRVEFNWAGILPLYPCSIFMYAMPFAIWGRGIVGCSACGYVCTLGLLGGLINFVYPANVLSSYSCLSFAGLHTLIYHGAIVFCAVTMQLSGYHRFTGVTKPYQLLLPSVPFLVVSVAANAVNFSPVQADYMFFKLQSFLFAPIGQALPTPLCVVMVYAAYLLLHAAPYVPSYIANRKALTTKRT